MAKVRITLAEWWQYEWRTFKQASSEIKLSTYVRGVILALITAALTNWGLVKAGVAGTHDTAVRFLISACAALGAFALFFCCEFLFKLLRAPLKLERRINEENDKTVRTTEKAIATKDLENQRLTAELQTLREQTQPLQVGAFPTVGGKKDDDIIIVWKDSFIVSVINQNPTREVSGVVVRLLKIEPPLQARNNGGSHSTDDCELRNIKLSFQDLPNDTLCGGVTGHIPIFTLERTTPMIIVKFCGQWASEYTNEFVPECHKEYVLTVEATAKCLQRKETRFRLSFSLDPTKPIVTASEILLTLPITQT